MAAATGSAINATSPRDTLTGVAARSVPVTRSRPLSLPTPPNSISPALPPHGLKAQMQKSAKLDPIDSDLDLQDAVDHDPLGRDSNLNDPGFAGARGGVAALAAAAAAAAAAADGTAVTADAMGSPLYESADTITPSMLAKFHLPEILLNHGPLAIRYIIGHLTASVPGFSFIPPAKSRRLVVAALEGRGNGGEACLGGLDGDVEFQKVSWGIWGARRVASGRQRSLPSPPLLATSLGIPIAASAGVGSGGGGGSGGSSGMGLSAGRLRQLNRQTAAFHLDDDHDMSVMENEADKMSMDESSASASCSEAPDDDILMNDDPDNVTDDEDWGAVGAAALRAASFSNPATVGRCTSRSYLASQPRPFVASYTPASSSKWPGLSNAARSPTQRSSIAMTGFTAFQDPSDEQEREAVEALLRLGSV